jgi:hypothetical protein
MFSTRPFALQRQKLLVIPLLKGLARLKSAISPALNGIYIFFMGASLGFRSGLQSA